MWNHVSTFVHNNRGDQWDKTAPEDEVVVVVDFSEVAFSFKNKTLSTPSKNGQKGQKGQKGKRGLGRMPDNQQTTIAEIVIFFPTVLR